MIGYITAKNLYERGARVLLLCRSDKKGRAALDQIRRDASPKYGSKVGQLGFLNLDLSSLNSVRRCAKVRS